MAQLTIQIRLTRSGLSHKRGLSVLCYAAPCYPLHFRRIAQLAYALLRSCWPRTGLVQYSRADATVAAEVTVGFLANGSQ